MAITFATGFEAQQPTTDSIQLNGTAIAYSTAKSRTGAASIRCNPASGGTVSISKPTLTANYNHFGLYVDTLPSVDRVIYGSKASGRIAVVLKTDGNLDIFIFTTLIGTTTGAPFATPGWHWIGVRNISGTSVVFLQVDGQDAVSGTATVTTTVFSLGVTDSAASAVDLYIDDLIFDDAGFLAPSKVDIALPISDNSNSNAVPWRLGDGSAMGGQGWEAINNAPPAGVASANETATSNIEHPGGASTEATYIANLESYTTLGVGASDTVLAVGGLVRHGEDITTGSKQLLHVGHLTNPTYAPGDSAVAGDGLGAHAAESGSNFWITLAGTLQTMPSVTLGTSPTISIGRSIDSRVACVDFMGLLVVWTPSGSTTVTGSFTADAILKRNQTGSFTANAIIKKVGVGGSFTADARLVKTTSGSLTANADIKRTIQSKIIEDTFTDSEGQQISNHTSDSGGKWIVSSGTPVIIGGAAQIPAGAEFHRTAAANGIITFITGTSNVSGTVGFRTGWSVITGTTTATLDHGGTIASWSTANGHTIKIVLSGSDIAVFDNGVQRAFDASGADAGGTTLSIFTQASIGYLDYVSFETGLVVDAALHKSQSGSFTTNAILREIVASTFTANADVKKAITPTFSADAVIKATRSSSPTANAVLKKTMAGSVTVDAAFAIGRTGSVTANAVFVSTRPGSFTVNAVFLRTFWFGQASAGFS